MRYVKIAVLCVYCVLSMPGFAKAACLHQVFGPPAKNSPYYYASVCFATAPDRTIIRNQVCSVASSTLVFSWSKLNWVSGSSGVPYGSCLVRSSYYSGAVLVGGSQITTNVASPQDTEVNLPDLHDGNKVYWDTIDGGGPHLEEGSVEPFHFEVGYEPKDIGDRVLIRATLVGDRPVFYLVLPREVRSQEDLGKFVSEDYAKQIGPLVTFGGEALKGKIGPQDILLAQFMDSVGVAERGVVSVRGEQKQARLTFEAKGGLKEVVGSIAICLAQDERITTCFRGAAE